MSANQAFSIQITPNGPGLWTTHAGPEWTNSGARLWGGYVIRLCVRALEVESEATGEALTATLTFIDALRPGAIDIRTRRLRRGGSVGVWQVELLQAGSERISVHAVITMARRPDTPPFAFARMPASPYPADATPPHTADSLQLATSGFERHRVRGYPPVKGGDSRSLTWMRWRHGPLDRPLLAMMADNAVPRAIYGLGREVMTTTLSLTIYLHATSAEIAEVGGDYILMECEGRVGGGGASDERSSYWRRDGKLLATSEQLVWYRAKAVT